MNVFFYHFLPPAWANWVAQFLSCFLKNLNKALILGRPWRWSLHCSLQARSWPRATNNHSILSSTFFRVVEVLQVEVFWAFFLNPLSHSERVSLANGSNTPPFSNVIFSEKPKTKNVFLGNYIQAQIQTHEAYAWYLQNDMWMVAQKAKHWYTLHEQECNTMTPRTMLHQNFARN